MRFWVIKDKNRHAGQSRVNALPPFYPRSRLACLFDSQSYRFYIKAFLITTVLLFTFICLAHAQDWTNEQIADAIYKAEGGLKAKKPYGILSVYCDSEQSCRKICLNTIRNNRKRFADYGHKQYDTYLEFLASRYCPVGADNDNGTNQYWLSNVLYFLEKTK